MPTSPHTKQFGHPAANGFKARKIYISFLLNFWVVLVVMVSSETSILLAQQPVTISWPLTSNDQAQFSSNIAHTDFSKSSAIDRVIFDPIYGATSGGWNSDTNNLDTYYEYRIAPSEGINLTINQLSIDISLSNGEMMTVVKYSTDGFRSQVEQIDRPMFFYTTTPRTLTLETNITVNYPDTLSLRVYGWKARERLVSFNNSNIVIKGIASGLQIISFEGKNTSRESNIIKTNEINYLKESLLVDINIPYQDTLHHNDSGIMAPLGLWEFYYPGTYTITIPSGVTCIKVESWGGGGGGGGAYIGAGGGGGGGAFNRTTFTVTPGETYTVIVGSGGTGGNNPNNGGNGGTSSVSGPAGTITANGGLGGESGIGYQFIIYFNENGIGGAGGAGGIYIGGNGGNSTGNPGNGAGGGGGAGNNGNGSPGGNAVTGIGGPGNPNIPPYIGGNGGAYRNTNNTGNNGNNPGGGGGGARSWSSSTSRSGGNGGNGQVIIAYISVFNITPAGTYCEGATVTIGLSGSEIGVNYQLYRDGIPIGSAIPGTGNPLSFGNHSIAGTYTVVGTMNDGSCTSNMNGTVVIISMPSPPSATGMTVCTGGSATLTASGAGANENYKWYDASTGGNLLFTGNPYNTPVLASTTTYYVSTFNTLAPACESSRTAVTATVVADPVWTSNIFTPTSLCVGGTVTFSATVSGGIGGTVTWIRAITSGGAGTTVTSPDTPPSTGTFYYRPHYNPTVSGCNLIDGTETIVIVSSDPAWTSNSVTPTLLCVGGEVSLIATVSGGLGGIISWIRSPTPGGAGTTVVSPDTPPAGTWYYRPQYTANGPGCNLSDGTETQVIVDQYPVPPTSITVDRDNFCADDNGNIVLTAVGGSGTTLSWFTGSCGGTEIGTGNPLTLGSPTLTTTYYARWENSCGNSTCASFTVTVRPLPVAPTAANVDRQGFCYTDAGTISLTASGGSGFTLEWFTGSCGGTQIGFTDGSPLVILSPDITTTYYVRWANDCGLSSCAPITVTVNTVTAGAIAVDQTICHGGDPAIITSTTNGTGLGSIYYRWEYAESPFTTWIEISGTTGSTYDPPAGLTMTRQYRRITLSSYNIPPCESEPTTPITVTVQSVPTPGSIGYDQSVCFNEDTDPIISVENGTGSGTISYRWELSVDPFTVWTTIPGATSASYDPGFLLQTTKFRRITVSTLNGVACESIVTNEVAIYVQEIAVTIGDIGYNQTICNGEIPQDLVSVTDGTGDGTITYEWQLYVNPGPWTDIIGEFGEALALDNPLFQTTQYRRRTKATLAGNSCYSDYTVAVVITVMNPVTPGSIGGTQTICYEGSATLTNIQSGLSPGATITYRWEESLDGVSNWTTIAGAIGSSYTYPALFQTTYFRRITVATTGTKVCESIPTNVVMVTVQIPVNPGSIAASQTICYSATPAPLTSTDSGSGSAPTVTYTWEYSTDGGTTWILISGATGLGYAPGALTVTTWYRRVTTSTLNGVPCSAPSAYVIITVNLQITASTVTPATQTICYNTIPAILTRTNASGGSGSFTYQWQSSPDGTTFSDITGQTGITYQPPALTATTYYRVKIVDASCGTVFSNVVKITVLPQVVAPVICCNQTVCFLGDIAPLTITTPGTGGYGTYSYQWQISTDGSTWTNIGGATGQTLNPPSANRYYRLVMTDPCGVVTSNIVYIEVVFDVSFDITVEPNVPSPLCPGASFSPYIQSIHGVWSAVRFSWSADPTYITPATGGPDGSTSDPNWWCLFLCRLSSDDIGPLTVHNPTAVPVTTTITLISSVYNYPGPPTGSFICNASQNYITITIQPFKINCPGSIGPLNNTTNYCHASVPTPNPTFVGSCSASKLTWTMTGATVDNSPTNGINYVGTHNFNVGVTTITYTATNSFNATTTCSFTITVVDSQLPSITCPGNITLPAEGACSRVVTYTAPVGTDNCPGAVTTQIAGLPSGSEFPIGTTTNTFQVTDASGNITTCSFTVTITDSEAPVISYCPPNEDRTTDPYYCTLLYDPPDPVVSDNCQGWTLTWIMTGATTGSSLSTGVNYVGLTEFNVGTTTITYTAKDSGGNTQICTFTITVTDNQAPDFSFCPAGYSVGNTTGYCYAQVTTQNPEYFDNCTVTSLTWIMTGSTVDNSPLTGINFVGTHVFNVGTTTITYTLTDNHGLSSQCSFQVIVSDTEYPNLMCPTSPQTRPANNLVCIYTTQGNEFNPVIASDNCSFTLTNNLNGTSTLNGYVFPLGTTNVKWTIADAANHVVICNFSVVIVDNQIPLITQCPANYAIEGCGTESITGLIYSETPVFITPGDWTSAGGIASDNCSLVTYEYIDSHMGVCPVIVTRIWKVTDIGGNHVSCTQKITIDDNSSPIITGNLAEIFIEGCVAGDAPAAFTTVAELEANGVSITDACTSDGNLVVSHNDVSAGDCPIVILRTYTITDACNNPSTIDQTINVDDNTPPVIATTAEDGDLGCNPTIVAPEFTGLDNCDGTFTPAVQTDGPFSIGCSFAQTWTASYTDDCGNEAIPITISYTWIVDAEAPEITCIGDKTAEPNSGNNYLHDNDIENWDAGATDNCPGTILLTYSFSGATPTPPPPNSTLDGIIFNPGITTVSWTAIDPCGNPATCSFDVTVLGTADIEIVKIGAPEPVTPGQNITYTITITNNGPATAPQIILTDDIPIQVINPEFSEDGGSTWSAWSDSWTVNNLANGESKIILIRGEVDCIISEFSNTAEVELITLTDPDPLNNTSTWNSTINDPPPSFDTQGPFEYCVQDIYAATWDGNPDPVPGADIVPIRPDWYILPAGSTDLNINNINDNCCDEDEMTITWTIDFIDSHLDISGTGQPSTYDDPAVPGFPDPITLWGTTDYTEIVHSISYWLQDCNGNTTGPVIVNITIKPRPNVIKQY